MRLEKSLKTSILSLVLLSLYAFQICSGRLSSEESRKLRADIKTFDDCLINSGNSFLYKNARPASSQSELATVCKRQQDSIKCVKDKMKLNLPAIIKRGLSGFLSAKSRMNKKYCTNMNSDLSKRYVSDMKCLLEKKADDFIRLETILASKIDAILERNYNDSAAELKQICCALYTIKRDMHKLNIEKACPDAKITSDEYINEHVRDDVSLICEDEDKLMTKICPKIDKLDLKTPVLGKGLNSAGLIIYLIATLGDAE